MIFYQHSAMCVDLFSLEIDVFNVINFYGSFLAKEVFWEYLFEDMTIREENVNIKGDKNWILRKDEVWGELGRMAPLVEFFLQNTEVVGVCDTKPLFPRPIWGNNRVVSGGTPKRLDRFQVEKDIEKNVGRIRSWIGEGGASYHVIIFLQVGELFSKPPCLFKVNSWLLMDLKFRDLDQGEWKKIENHLDNYIMYKFSENIKRFKMKTIGKAKGKCEGPKKQL